MTDEELAHRRRKADDLVLLNKMARVNGITVKQAHTILYNLCNRLETLSEQERDELMANIPILSHILD
jgi:hypothetical protein